MFQRIDLATLSVSVTLFAGCASTESKKPTTPATITVVNTICPIAGDDFARHEIPANLTREWQGTKIGFCCEHCVPNFDNMTTAEKNNLRSLALANKALVNPEE